jgi:hypothetical protein
MLQGDSKIIHSVSIWQTGAILEDNRQDTGEFGLSGLQGGLNRRIDSLDARLYTAFDHWGKAG